MSKQFTADQAKNWMLMIDALKLAKKKRNKYDISDPNHCPCGHYLKHVGLSYYGDPYDDIKDVVRDCFGNSYSQNGDIFDKYFTGDGPRTINLAIEQAEQILKERWKEQTMTSVTINDKKKLVPFVKLNIGQPFKYEDELLIKYGDDSAFNISDNCDTAQWKDTKVEPVSIEINIL